MDNTVVNPVTVDHNKRIYQKTSPLIDKTNLQKELQKKGLNITLKESLKGGFISQVYSAILDGKEVVVKHTADAIPFDPTELYLDKKSHDVDCNILKNLQNNPKVKVPKLLFDFADITTSIMENLYSKDFELMQDQILNNKLSIESAESIGRSIAYLTIESRRWKEFPVVQTASMSIYERRLELRLVYPNSQKEYLHLEKEYIKNNRYWSWPDCHPKNIFVNQKGEVAFIDFGYSQRADQRFILPSHLAHIVIYSLAGYIEKDLAKDYILRCIDTSKKIESIDENIFCQYLAMEVFHRANGKWVVGIETKEQKLALHKFGFTIFDEKRSTVNQLIDLL